MWEKEKQRGALIQTNTNNNKTCPKFSFHYTLKSTVNTRIMGNTHTPSQTEDDATFNSTQNGGFHSGIKHGYRNSSSIQFNPPALSKFKNTRCLTERCPPSASLLAFTEVAPSQGWVSESSWGTVLCFYFYIFFTRFNLYTDFKLHVLKKTTTTLTIRIRKSCKTSESVIRTLTHQELQRLGWSRWHCFWHLALIPFLFFGTVK